MDSRKDKRNFLKRERSKAFYLCDQVEEIGLNLKIILLKFGCYKYIEDKDIDETIELIIDTYNSFWEERSFYRYTLETTLYSFFGDNKRKIDSYYDYARKVNSENKQDEIITEEEIDNKRKQAKKLEKELKEGGEWVSE